MITQKPFMSLRNPFGPRADRLSVALPIDSGIGSDLTDLGLSYPVSNPLGGDLTFNPQVLDFGMNPVIDAWESDYEGTYLHIDSTVVPNPYFLRLFNNPLGADTILFPRGTMMIRFSFASFTAARSQGIFTSGLRATAPAIPNQLGISKFTSDDIIRITHSNSFSETIVFDLAWDSSSFDTVRTLIYTWGEAGSAAWLDNDEGVVNTTVGDLESTTQGWEIRSNQDMNLGIEHDDDHLGDLRVYAFCMWDCQLRQVEREELFVDAYLPFRPRAQDYSGSDEIEIFATDVNPIPCRPKLNSDSNTDGITFSAVTSKELPDGITIAMRILYSTDPLLIDVQESPIGYQTDPSRQINVILDGLEEGIKYYWLAQFGIGSSEQSFQWIIFPGGKGRFYTQNRYSPDFSFAVISDDHIGATESGGPPYDDRGAGAEAPYVGYGGDIIRHRLATGNNRRKIFYAWRTFYDIYINQDPHFIVHCGDYYYADNYLVIGADNANDAPYYNAKFYRNWCNLLFKSGVVYFAQGNHENESGYSQRETGASQPYAQMISTIARKTFFPNPTYETYPQGGENETPTTSRAVNWIPTEGNDWIPALNSVSSTEGDQTRPGTSTIVYDQSYRDEFILGFDADDPYATTSLFDPYGLNRSPLENYYAWTWGDALFVVLDPHRYTEPGDPLNTGGDSSRTGPVWTLGSTQKIWLRGVLSSSNQKRKFVFSHTLLGGESINTVCSQSLLTGYYARGSGININRTTTINGTYTSYEGTVESSEEQELHEMFKKFGITGFLKGHDHRFAHVINEDVNYITVGCAGSEFQWDTDRIRESYGYTEEGSSQTGNRLSLGVISVSNNYSYCIFSITQDEATYRNRVAVVKTTSLCEDFTYPVLGKIGGTNHGAGWAGPLYTLDSADQLTLSERPNDIYTIGRESDTVFNSDLLCNLYPAASTVDQLLNLWPEDGIDDNWEEFHGSNVITLDSSGVAIATTEDLRVMHVPVDFDSNEVLNAVPDSTQEVHQHNISPDYAVYIYNINIADSIELAEYYRLKRHLPAENLIGLDMRIPTASSCEAPISKTEFESTILTPLREAISDIEIIGSGQFQCAVIILGYGTPLAYVEDDDEIIAIASRLHRINFEYDKKHPNHTYDRRGAWKFYDELDSQQVCLTAVLDGPTPEAVKKLIDRSVEVSQQLFVTGKIYVDPYGKKVTSDQLQYQTDILDFVENELPNLGLDLVSTVDESDPTLEPTIAYLKNDSFYWGWYNPTYSKDLFLNQNEKRVFLYNADNEAACQIHFLSDDGTPFDENGSDPWCNLAINVEPGYAATAGSISAPDEYDAGIVGEDSYLRPRPFFEALHRGASLAEAFLFSSPYVNWKIILIGDPLMTVLFALDLPPDQDPTNTLIDNNEMIRRVKESIEIGLGWGQRQLRLIQDALDTNVDSTGNIAEEVYLLYGLAEWRNRKDATSLNEIYNIPILGWLGYILKTTRLPLGDWLDRENKKISDRLHSALKSLPARVDIDTTFIYSEGEWEYVFVYIHPVLSFENVHFELQVSSDTSFTDFVVDISTQNNVTGWKYEQEPNTFVQLVSVGFPSNFSGRRVKFVSPTENRLTRTEIYYVRWRAIDVNGSPITEWDEDTNPMLVYR